MSSSGPRYFQQTLMQKSGPHEFVEKFVTERNDELHATEVRTQHSRTPWSCCGCPSDHLMPEPSHVLSARVVPAGIQSILPWLIASVFSALRRRR